MKNNEMLDVLDRIDEDILERNTQKRCALWAKLTPSSQGRGGKSKNIAIIALAATLALTLAAFAVFIVMSQGDNPLLPPSGDTEGESQPLPTEGISSIERTATDGDKSTYTITYGDGSTATLEITDHAPDGSGAKITGVTFDETSNVYLTLATGKLLSMGQSVGMTASSPSLKRGGFTALAFHSFVALADETSTSASIAGVEVDEQENMSYHLNNGKQLALGHVHKKSEAGEDTSMSMACINEAGELVLGFASGETMNLGRVVGKDGKDGVGIEGITLSDAGELSVALTNGTILNLGNIKGQDGIGIAESKINDAGELVLTYTDGNSVNLGRVVGEKGEDGVGIGSININDAGELTIVLTDGTNLNLGNIKGQDGKSAYELYKDKFGYEGTEEEWLSDLVNGNLATKIKYPVTFDSAGGSDVPTQEIEEGGKVVEPEIPARKGYTFKGWHLGEELWSFAGYSVTEPITLTAKWEIVTYTVTVSSKMWTVYLKEGDTMPTSYTIEDTLRIPDLPMTSFEGWVYDGQDTPQKGLVFPAGSIAQDIILHPKTSISSSFDVAPVDKGTWLLDGGGFGNCSLVVDEPDANVYAVADGTVLAIENRERANDGSGFSLLLLGINNNTSVVFYHLLSLDLPEYIYVGAEVSKGDVIGQVDGGWYRDAYRDYEHFEDMWVDVNPGDWILWDYGCMVSVFSNFSTPLTQEILTEYSTRPEELANVLLRDYGAENFGLWAYLTPEASEKLTCDYAFSNWR